MDKSWLMRFERWGTSFKESAERDLAGFYPKAQDGATPIAYLWARTIHCEGPGCGAEVPLIRSLLLAKKPGRMIALRPVPNHKAKRLDFKIILKQGEEWVDQSNKHKKIEEPRLHGTVRRGSATCPCCGFTAPVARVREQLKSRKGGTSDARLLSIITTRPTEQGRFYGFPTEADLEAISAASTHLRK